MSENAALTEQVHVHDVYDRIAEHFSQTRYKQWPIIENFLHQLPPNSLVADIGCGNGKNMNISQPRNLRFVGVDYCAALARLCATSRPKAEALIGDNLCLPFREKCFDYALSIAVIHHFSTEQRRQKAIQELIRCVRCGGKVLIFVWAMEQSSTSKRTFYSQDSMVPWKDSQTQTTYQRFYHLFRRGELERLCQKAALSEGRSVEFDHQCAYDRDNWYCVMTIY